MIKTVYETAAILQALQGANDVHMRQIEPNRYNHSLSWDARSLKLFRDGLHFLVFLSLAH